MKDTHVVTCFLHHRGEVLLLHRSKQVGSYQGMWGAVAGHAEGDADASARTEIEEETGLGDAVALIRKGEPFAVDDEALERRWIVHPYLFACERRDFALNWESTEGAWVSPAEILRRESVPQLWTSYRHVAPTVETVRDDHAHGAAHLSLVALEVLRDHASAIAYGGGTSGDDLTTLDDMAIALCEARPAMAAVSNRINRVMYACRDDRSAARVAGEAHRTIAVAMEAGEGAARHAAALVNGKHVLTLSRSGTVMQALLEGRPARVVVAESRPAREGVGVAEQLAAAGIETTLVADAAMAHAMEAMPVDVVLIGADAVLPAGGVVNKTGSRLAALAARDAGIPCFAVAAIDKIDMDDHARLEEGPPTDLYRGKEAVIVRNPTFEVVPASLLSGIVTEAGTMGPADVRRASKRLEALAGWR